MKIIIINWVLVVISLLLCVLFFTMFERKFLSYIQIRKGPNKVGFLGLLTPVSDTIKLILKTSSLVSSGNSLLYFFGPFFSIFILFILWSLCPFVYFNNNFFFGLIAFFCLSSLNVYSVLSSGWGSNSKYSMLGAFRGVAQVVSYEIILLFVAFFPICSQGSYNLFDYLYNNFVFGIWLFPLFILWLISCVAETNRSPFDFAEGESELVSGFNTEYGALEFAFLFLGEYGQILFISCLSFLLFFPNFLNLEYIFFGILIAVSFIWFRASFPRFRYDLFMNMAWNIGLIFLFFFFFYIISL
uniref:NADH dehydrogenase subunit 1 n=1 Tax=Bipalium admarginatum TaxID=3023024 RepID=UPI002411241E|nr:NADH dehydrogenase subunit 1 [Bipalium admarginatum]WEM34732.1 NADH dehydrogenase subunit 1 [Bipalium admarginatum]